MGRRTKEEVKELIRNMAFHIVHTECTLISVADHFDVTPGYASKLMDKKSIRNVEPLMEEAVRTVIESHRPYPGMADYMRRKKDISSTTSIAFPGKKQ